MSIVQPMVSGSGDGLVGDGAPLSVSASAAPNVVTGRPQVDTSAPGQLPHLSPKSLREASQRAARAEIQSLVDSNPLDLPTVRTPTNFATHGGGAEVVGAAPSADQLPTTGSQQTQSRLRRYSTGKTSPSGGRHTPRTKSPSGRRTPRSSDGRRSSATGRRGSGATRRRRSSLFRHDKHSLVGPVHSEERASFKERVWALVDEPGSSVWARFIAIFIMLLIGISCLTFCLETLPAFHKKDVVVWNTIEAVCIAFFTLEYVLRFLSCPAKCPFLKDVLNTIDLVAIVPFYVEFFIGGDSSGSAVFRVVRLVRVFRVFKISRYVSWVKIFANAMYASAQPLGMLLFVMAIGCIVFSSAIYFAERGTWNQERGAYLRWKDGVLEHSPYQSIPASFWWCIITMTTVGYGDHVPVTFAGKLIAAITSLSGILVLAIPITVISTNFNYEFGRMKKKREAMRQKMLMFKRHFGAKQHKGLGIIKDEIEQMVRRNAAELMQDFQNVVQASKDELGSELYALVQVAYHQRERLIALDKVAADAQRAQALEQGGSAAAKYATDGQRTSAGGLSGAHTLTDPGATGGARAPDSDSKGVPGSS